jgi:hypothetical protein
MCPHALGCLFVGSQALVDQRTDRRGANRGGHVLPVNRGTGVQHHIAGQPRYDFASRSDVDQDLLSIEHVPHSHLVRRVNLPVPGTPK